MIHMRSTVYISYDCCSEGCCEREIVLHIYEYKDISNVVPSAQNIANNFSQL